MTATRELTRVPQQVQDRLYDPRHAPRPGEGVVYSVELDVVEGQELHFILCEHGRWVAWMEDRAALPDPDGRREMRYLDHASDRMYRHEGKCHLAVRRMMAAFALAQQAETVRGVRSV